MAETTNIEWCHHTFNPWRGCTKISPGCANCYAEALSVRNPSVLGEWGPSGKRVIAAESYWKQPLVWNRKAQKAGERRRVFCASLADLFEDRQELDEPLARVLKLIHLTPHLDWLLLTKRPELIGRRLEQVRKLASSTSQDISDGAELADQWIKGVAMPNAWLGASVEDRQRAHERVSWLLQVPAAVHFLSLEPLLEEIGLARWIALNRQGLAMEGHFPLSWVIVGGESGRHARPCRVEWIRSIVEQCQVANVRVFVKQLGANVRWAPRSGPCGLWADHVRFDYQNYGGDSVHRILLRDHKGGDPDEWPADLRVREFPTARAYS